MWLTLHTPRLWRSKRTPYMPKVGRAMGFVRHTGKETIHALALLRLIFSTGLFGQCVALRMSAIVRSSDYGDSGGKNLAQAH